MVMITVLRFLVGVSGLWALQVLLAPAWLVNNRGGINAVLTVVPPTVVSVFVLVLGSLLVVAQQATTAHGTRAPLMLIFDPRARALVVGPLVLTFGALGLTGLVARKGPPSDALLAASSTLVEATAVVLVLSATRLFSLLLEYVSPFNFANAVLRNVDRLLAKRQTGMVVFRVGLLGEMARSSIRRGDGPGTSAAFSGLNRLTDNYLDGARRDSQVREHEYDGRRVVGWMGDELHAALVSVGSDALLAGAPESVSTGVAELLERLATTAIGAGWTHEFDEACAALAELGTSVQQMTPSGAVNFHAPAAFGLARLERAAEPLDSERAAQALALWTLVVSYWAVHFRINEQTAIARGLWDIGEAAPWNRTHDLLIDDGFEDRWLNKMPNGPMGVIGTFAQARQAHDEIHGHVSAPSTQDTLDDLQRKVEQLRPGRLRRLWKMLEAGLPD